MSSGPNIGGLLILAVGIIGGLLVAGWIVGLFSAAQPTVTFTNVSVQMNYPPLGSSCFGSSTYFPSITVPKGKVMTYNITMADSCTGKHTINNIYAGDGLTYNLTQPILPYPVYSKGNIVVASLQISIPYSSQGGVMHLFVNAS